MQRVVKAIMGYAQVPLGVHGKGTSLSCGIKEVLPLAVSSEETTARDSQLYVCMCV